MSSLKISKKVREGKNSPTLESHRIQIVSIAIAQEGAKCSKSMQVATDIYCLFNLVLISY